MQRSVDAIVIGLGAHGSAAALALARRGVGVLGIESGGRAHGLGSSGGRSRMIRRAYFEDPAYLPLLAAAWDGWQVLAAESGEPLIEVTGGLYAGPADSAVLQGSVASARDQGLAHEVIDAAEIGHRWPLFTLGDEMAGLFDPGAGMIRPERAIEAQLAEAERRGAELHFGERASDWRPGPGGGFEVETDRAVYPTGRLVIAAGAWTGYFVPDLELPLAVERMPIFWFGPRLEIGAKPIGHLPVWIVDSGVDGSFYGFPTDPGVGLKVARHHSGEFVEPDAVDRTARPADVERIRAFMRRFAPSANGEVLASSVCLYTNTPDFHFVIDRHPAAAGVAFASACSGHGFKFAPVIGEILADLVLDGATSSPIERFRAGRFAR